MRVARDPDARAGSGVERVFRCPASPDNTEWTPRFGTGPKYATETDSGFGYAPGELLLQVDRVPFSYGYNDWGVGPPRTEQRGLGGDIMSPPKPDGWGRELRAGVVRKPAEMIAIGDATVEGSWDYNIDPTEPAQYPGKIHRNGANILFCDGHVEWFPQKQLVNIKKDDPVGARMNRMWNNDNQIH
jgi:prepilin-type processing-associated H-X9-DG protein